MTGFFDEFPEQENGADETLYSLLWDFPGFREFVVSVTVGGKNRVNDRVAVKAMKEGFLTCQGL